MHTFHIILKTLGTVFFLGVDMVAFIAFLQGDVLGRGPSKTQGLILLVILACAVGIWFL